MSSALMAIAMILLTVQTGLSGELEVTDPGPDPRYIRSCDAGVLVSEEERKTLLETLRISNAGKQLLAQFIHQYSSLSNLVLQWDTVSYSQISSPTNRAPASGTKGLGEAVCIHLAHRLPEIEHVADLAHELTHATRLAMPVLKGDVDSADEFVKARLSSKGGEADAFTVECAVKRELLGRWDPLCTPYSEGENFDTERVIRDFYSGKLSASLTGEPYPVLLKRQFQSMQERKGTAAKSRVRYSGLENKQGFQ